MVNNYPIDWSIQNLEEVAIDKVGIKRGPFGGSLKKEIFVRNGYAVYEQQHVINNNFEAFRYFISEEKFNELKKFEVLPGDLLISCSGTVGKTALVPEGITPGVINQALLRIRLNKSILMNKFAWYLFISDFLHSKMTDMSHGSTLKNIVSVKQLKQIKIPIPTLKEQSKIAAILSSVDDAIEKTAAIIQQTKKVKKGLMQQLFTKGTQGHESFKETKVGNIPEEWTVVKLFDLMIGKSQNGLYKPKDCYGSGHGMVHMGEMFKEDILDVSNLQEVSVTDNEEKKFGLEEGDILFARRSIVFEGAGKAVFVPALTKPVTFESSIIRITLDKDIIDPMFLTLYFSSSAGRKNMSRIVRQLSVSGIASEDLMKLPIPIPKREEQEQIVKTILSLKKKIKIEKRKAFQLSNIKTGLMQDLLTGKVRVNVDEEEVVSS